MNDINEETPESYQEDFVKNFRRLSRALSSQAVLPIDHEYPGITSIPPPLLSSKSCGTVLTESLKKIHTSKLDANIPNEKGETPILVASLNGFLDIVKYLVDHGKANPDIPNQVLIVSWSFLSTCVCFV